MSLKSSIIYTLFFACLLSCESEMSNDLPTAFHHRWKWISTSGGFVGGLWTPTSTGKNFLFDFQNSDTVRVFRNDTLVHSGAYSLTLNAEAHGWELLLYSSDTNLSKELNPGLKDFASIAEVISDTLTLYSWRRSDGYSSLYIRQ
jgi:hypothetical protein